MKYDLRFLKILLWEALENAPILVAFLWAADIQSKNFPFALAILLIGAAGSAGLIHFTETKKFGIQPNWKETLVNFTVFSILTIPFIFYVSADHVWWSNWITDIILGILAGLFVDIGESYGWRDKSKIRVHAVSMASIAVFSLWGIRLTHNADVIVSIIVVSIVVNLLASIIIVSLDYWPIKEPNQITAKK